MILYHIKYFLHEIVMLWSLLLSEYHSTSDPGIKIPDDDWKTEIIHSICEQYYLRFKTRRGSRKNQRIDYRPASDFSRFWRSHLKPLKKYKVWEAMFPNRYSASSAIALDEAILLLYESNIVDRIYSGDLVTVQKIISDIKEKRAKYLDIL